MVSESKPPIVTHDPATCQGCDRRRVEQILSDTGGWEWVDEGRPAPPSKPEPRLPWAWLVVEACVWLFAAVVIVWIAGQAIRW